MAGANEIHIKSERLLQELEIWRFTVNPKSNLFENKVFLKDFVAFKLDIVQGFLEELQVWEETRNETKCKNAIDNAEFFLGQIQVLFDSMFEDQYQATWQDMEEELVFADYIQ